MINIPDLLQQAEAGSTVAQAVLGVALLEGTEAPPDYPEAFRWLSAASEKGAARATLHLGVMYERGLAVVRDTRRARELYEAAAEHGEFLGSVFLARLLASGTCGPVNTEGALRWYRQALWQASRVQECPELEEARAYLAANG
jgi:hypothetical protein